MQTRKVYFAGELFDHKDIIGNLLMACSIENVSGQKYKVELPQDSEENEKRSTKSIRDRDIELLLSCDCIVANFDGTELDSGTVVEFCLAKQLGLPAVLLRTDFRKGGDNGTDPWNLMCSGYPRTSTLLLSAMEQYHRLKTADAVTSVMNMCNEAATLIISDLEELFSQKPVLSEEEAVRAMELAVKSSGGTLGVLFPEERIRQLCSEKAIKGVY